MQRRTSFWLKPQWWAIVLMVATCVVLMTLNATTHQMVTANMAEADGYFAQAERMLQGGTYVDRYRPPLYVTLITVTSFITRVRPFVAGMLISSLAVSLMVGLTFVLAHWFVSSRYALLAEWLVAVDSLVVFHGLQVSTDALFALLSLTVLTLSVVWLRGSASRCKLTVAVGVVLGAAYLTRYTALFLIPVILYAIGASGDPLRAKLRYCSWIGIAFIVVTLPWLAYNTVINGSPFANDNWHNFAFAVMGNGQWENFESAQASFQGYVDILRQAPIRVLQTWGASSLDIIRAIPTDHTSSPLLAFFLPIGLVLLGRSQVKRLLIIYGAACVLLVTVAFVYIERLLLPVLPVFIIAAIVGLSWILPRLLQRRLIGRVVALALPVCVLILPWLRLPVRINIYLAAQPITEVKMLDWLIEQEHATNTRPVRVVSMYNYASDFVLYPDRIQNFPLPSWFQREFYYSDQFKRLLSDTVAVHQAQFVLLSDRLTYGTIESDQVNVILSACWLLVREERDFTGKTRLYRHTCPS